MRERLREIEQRLAAIRGELNEDGADINALNEEVDRLTEERRGIRERIESRRTLLGKIGAGEFGNGDPVTPPAPEERTFDRSSAEYRSAYLKHVRGLEMTEVEKRAFTTAAGSAGAVIPTQTANEIITKMKQRAPLLGEVTLLHVAGNVTFAVEGTTADAAIHSENAALTAATDTLVKVSLGAYEINKLIQISKSVMTMSIDAFEAWLTDMLAEKITDKIAYYLILGTGSSQPQGVDAAGTWDATNSVTVTKTADLSAANVRTLIGLLNGGYDRNAKFLMSKKTLFNDFMPLQDSSKNNLVRDENGSYFIHGYPVMLDDNVTVHEAYLGDFKKIVANLSEEINIVSGFDIDTNSYKFLGCSMFDSKVADAAAFVKLVKATS